MEYPIAVRSRPLYLYQQGVNTTTPAGKALFQTIGVVAEIERAILKARTNGTGMVTIAYQVGCGVGMVQRVLIENKAWPRSGKIKSVRYMLNRRHSAHQT